VLANAAGAKLFVEVGATAGPAGEQETAFVANNWKAVGVDATPALRPRVLAGDPELDATFPGGYSSNRPITPENFVWTTPQIPLQQNRYLGANRGGFSDPEVDRAWNAILTATSQQGFLDNSVPLHK